MAGAASKPGRLPRLCARCSKTPAIARCWKKKARRKSQGRLGNLDELLNAAVDAAERGETIRDFLDHAALVADADSLDARAPVSLLTMHNAKGLEFPVVFIAGLEEGLFPHSRSLDSESAHGRRTPPVLRRHDARREAPVFELGALPPPLRRRAAGAFHPLALPEGGPARRCSSRCARRRRARQVDLYAERTRSAKPRSKNLYTGKTYNSVDNIRQFFAGRGTPVAARRRTGCSGQASRSASEAGPQSTPKMQENWAGLDHRTRQVRPRHHRARWKARATIPK